MSIAQKVIEQMAVEFTEENIEEHTDEMIDKSIKQKAKVPKYYNQTTPKQQNKKQKKEKQQNRKQQDERLHNEEQQKKKQQDERLHIEKQRNKKQQNKLQQNRKQQGMDTQRQIFIIGSKGIPAAYGGFETFVEKLTKFRKSNYLYYHVACMSDENSSTIYNNSRCFNIKVPDIGAAKAIYYDCAALSHCIRYCKARPEIKNPIFYILACRVGPFIWHYKRRIRKLGGVLYVNPDGHEWKRAKWSALVRWYWKLSEQLMVKYSDLMICDSKNIEQYIQEEYQQYKPATTFIAYGAETKRSVYSDQNEKYLQWLSENKLTEKQYYLVVGRFVPENNYETMIKEFKKTNTTKSFALVTNVSETFLKELRERTGFDQDSRIKFVGTVYDNELLKKIRENAYGYFHGHEVGGTNPSLLEALCSTELNLLLDVGFNREVAKDGALYWNKEDGSLARLIEEVEAMDTESRHKLGSKARTRITNEYSWDYIIDKYEDVFLKENGNVETSKWRPKNTHTNIWREYS